MVGQIYPTELQLNKTNSSDTEAPFLDLNLSITNGIVSSKILDIDNPYFEQMVGQIYPTELQLNKANSSNTEAPFLDLNLSITNGIVSS